LIACYAADLLVLLIVLSAVVFLGLNRMVTRPL